MMYAAGEKIGLLPAAISTDDILGIIIPKSKGGLMPLPISGGIS
jgi:hypothetical protein